MKRGDIPFKNVSTFDIGKEPYVADCKVWTPWRVIDWASNSNQPIPPSGQLGISDMSGCMARCAVFLEEDAFKVISRLKNGVDFSKDFTK